jgi:TRAP-type C4-dicarboxylate transport system permease small subunit
MRGLLKVIDLLCGAGAAVGALACLALAVMLVVEVITTSFLAWSQPWAVEYSGYLLAPTLFAGAGWTLSRGGHIRVAVLLDMMPPAMLRAVDLACSAAALLVTAYVTQALTHNALRSLEIGTVSYYPSRTPVWIPQMVLAVGWGLLTLGVLARLLRLVAGEPPETPRATAKADPAGGAS